MDQRCSFAVPLALLAVATCVHRAPERVPGTVLIGPAPAGSEHAVTRRALSDAAPDVPTAAAACVDTYNETVLERCEPALDCTDPNCDQRLVLDFYNGCIAEAENDLEKCRCDATPDPLACYEADGGAVAP